MSKVTMFLLCAFVAFLPFEMMAWIGDLPSGAKVAGMLVMISGALAFLAGHPVRMLSLPMTMRVAIVLYSAMSLGWSLAPEATQANLPRIALLLIFVLLIWEFAVTYTDQVWLLRSVLVGMIVPLSMAFGAFGGVTRTTAETTEMRFTGGGHDANYLAFMYSISILIAVYLASSSLPLDRYFRWFYWGMAVLCAMGTFLTGSRGGFLCLVVAAVWSMVLAGVSRRRITTIVQILAGTLLVYFLAREFVPTILLNRVTAEQGFDAHTLHVRFGYWERGMAAYLRSPLLGVGAGAYGPAALMVTGEYTGVAHNAFISVLVELGIVGLALYLSYIVLLFRAAWGMARREKLLWTGIMVVWCLGASSAGSQIDKFSWFLHVMVLTQAAIRPQRALRKPSPYPQRVVPIVRGPMPPRLGSS